MKTLQNNFTTPEQSKRLLELGFPADSADCYLLKCRYGNDVFHPQLLNDELYSQKDKFTNVLCYMPCWSVGRLMEIYLICQTFGDGLHFFTADDWDENMLDELCNLFSTMVKYNYIDFLKLEE